MHQLPDCNISYESVPIMCDKTSDINLSKYTMHHSRDKHIDIEHLFIPDRIVNGFIFVDLKIILRIFLQESLTIKDFVF